MQVVDARTVLQDASRIGNSRACLRSLEMRRVDSVSLATIPLAHLACNPSYRVVHDFSGAEAKAQKRLWVFPDLSDSLVRS